MNILTAPLFFLFAGLGMNRLRAPPPDPRATFLKAGILLCLIVIVAGLVFTYQGITGDVVVNVGGNTLRTGAVGFALVFIGLAFYLLIGRAIIKP